jgi:hypothetical protein
VAQALEFDGDTPLDLNGVKGITRHDTLTISLRLFCPEPKDRAVILHSGPRLYSQSADASGFEILLEKGKLRWSAIHIWPGCAASIETTGPFPVGKWVQVTVTYDGTSSAEGMKMYFDGQLAKTTVLKNHLDKNIVAETFRLASRPRDDRGFAQGKIDDLSVSAMLSHLWKSRNWRGALRMPCSNKPNKDTAAPSRRSRNTISLMSMQISPLRAPP